MRTTAHIKSILLALGGILLMQPADSAAKEPIHTQLDQLAEMAKGKRLGVLTNGSARIESGQHDVDYLLSHEGTTITAFFGPEHGFRGDIQDGSKIVDGIDPETGVPVYSLYGKRHAPTDEQLANVDMFVFDIPDVGARFYTYTWTMTHCLDACARKGIPFVVVDRPNPITGKHVEGAVNEKDLGLIGRLGKDAEFGVATRHGLTIGEVATMWNEEWTTPPKAKLHVIKVPDWKRDQWLDETQWKFIAPSPNMRTLTCATVYPGTCIFEGTNMNEGRGTSAPFEMMGAPFIDGDAWASDLTALELPGVKFEGIRFTPEARRFKGEECGGVKITVTDREAFQAVRTGVHMLQTVVKRYPDQVKITDYAGRLMATPDLATRIKTEPADDIVKSWEPGLEKYKALRAKYLLYPEGE